jgi:hypothetical protein
MTDGNALLVGIGTMAAGALVVELSKHFANVVIGSSEKLEAEKYEEMHRRLDGKNFHIARTPMPRDPVSRIRSRVMGPGKHDNSVSPVMEHIHGALQQLEEAKKSTRCGVCQKGAAAAIEAVKRESEVIVRADSKYQVIQDLKNAGKLPKDARWDKLNPGQKKFINDYVERRIQHGTY